MTPHDKIADTVKPPHILSKVTRKSLKRFHYKAHIFMIAPLPHNACPVFLVQVLSICLRGSNVQGTALLIS